MTSHGEAHAEVNQRRPVVEKRQPRAPLRPPERRQLETSHDAHSCAREPLTSASAQEGQSVAAVSESCRQLTKGELLLQSEPRPNAPPLPACLRSERRLYFDTAQHQLYQAACALLKRTGDRLGNFPAGSSVTPLEDFQPTVDVFRSFKARQILYRAVAEDASFLEAYEQLVCSVVLPYLKGMLEAHERDCPSVAGHAAFADESIAGGGYHVAVSCRAAGSFSSPKRFFYQFPPSVRVQPGPRDHFGRRHRDAEYGHQEGEINFWMPLTAHALTRTCLWVESTPGAHDFHPLDIPYGCIAAFHGTLCQHFVPPNSTSYTRVSLDFRVGVDSYFDPSWQFKSAKAQHGRKEMSL